MIVWIQFVSTVIQLMNGHLQNVVKPFTVHCVNTLKLDAHLVEQYVVKMNIIYAQSVISHTVVLVKICTVMKTSGEICVVECKMKYYHIKNMCMFFTVFSK